MDVTSGTVLKYFPVKDNSDSSIGLLLSTLQPNASRARARVRAYACVLWIRHRRRRRFVVVRRR